MQNIQRRVRVRDRPLLCECLALVVHVFPEQNLAVVEEEEDETVDLCLSKLVSICSQRCIYRAKDEPHGH